MNGRSEARLARLEQALNVGQAEQHPVDFAGWMRAGHALDEAFRRWQQGEAQPGMPTTIAGWEQRLEAHGEAFRRWVDGGKGAAREEAWPSAEGRAIDAFPET